MRKHGPYVLRDLFPLCHLSLTAEKQIPLSPDPQRPHPESEGDSQAFLKESCWWWEENGCDKCHNSSDSKLGWGCGFKLLKKKKLNILSWSFQNF